jgi:hypothetical protein
MRRIAVDVPDKCENDCLLMRQVPFNNSWIYECSLFDVRIIIGKTYPPCREAEIRREGE